MADLSGLGDLVITVGGDITPLTSALDEIPAAAQQSAAQIQAAFDALPSATEEVNQSLANLSTTLNEAGSHASETAGHIDEMPPALHDTSDAAHEAESSFGEFIKTSLELAGIVISLEALKEATIGALETFGEFQRASEALTAITHNATAAGEALERIPALADQLGVSIQSLESAQQKFALFGVDLEAMPPLFEAIANASVASGSSFDAVASSFERMDNTGKLMARTLQAAGLNMQDVAKAMDMEGASSKEVTKAFAALGDGAEGAAARAQVLIDATQKMAGVARATADDITGSWNQMKNAVHEAMVNIGESLSQLGQAGGLGLLKAGIAGVETFVVSLIGYLGQAIDLVKGFAKIAGDEFSAIGKAAGDVAHGEFSKAWADIKAGDEQMVADFGAMSTKMQADWDANGKIIDKIWAETATAVNASSKAMGDGLDKASASANDTADAVTKAGKATSSFVGPIYQANLGIQMMAGAEADATDRAARLVDGIEVLNGTATTLTDDFDAMKTTVIGAGDAFSQTAQDLLNYVNDLGSADEAVNQLSEDMQTAAISAGTLADAVSRGIISGASQGGSGTIHGQPGDEISGGPTSGGAMGAAGTHIALGTPLQRAEKQLADLQAPYQLQQIYDQIANLGKAGPVLNTAATNLTAAAQVQQDAAQTAYDAAKAQLVGAKQLEVAANATATGADAISAGVLAAADAANQAASDASMAMVTSSTIAAAAAQAIAGATSAILVTTQIAAAVATKAGVPGFTTFTAFTTPSPNLPNVSGPGPSSTGGLAFANPYTYSGGNAGNSPVNINVNGSQFIQNLMNEFVQNLQTQGVRLVRG